MHFLRKKQPIYSCKFGFRQKHSTIHALIHLTEKISNQLHCVKSVRIRSFSGPYFPAFGLNTERKSIYVQSECGKIRTRTRYDNYYKIDARNHVRVSEFWPMWRTWRNTKNIRHHTFYLVIFLTIFPKLVLTQRLPPLQNNF